MCRDGSGAYAEAIRRVPQYRPAPIVHLFAEIKALGYQSAFNLLHRYITQGRVEADRLPISPRHLARLLLTRPGNLTGKQRSLLDTLTAACPEMIGMAGLVRAFAGLLRPHEGNADRLDTWITTVRAADLPHLHAFTRGLDQGRDAVHAAATLSTTTAAPKA
ncbi:hypothetical protein GCM10017559_49270 [Streptosporangium longisporum]|uniref:Transposase n=1 Tax=Streptosporangium longisporum TaxID=46187 RepID=A0ABP6KU20_9ACTN